MCSPRIIFCASHVSKVLSCLTWRHQNPLHSAGIRNVWTCDTSRVSVWPHPYSGAQTHRQSIHQWLLLMPESLCAHVLVSHSCCVIKCLIQIQGHTDVSAFPSALRLEAISRRGDTRQGCLAGFHVSFLCVCAFPLLTVGRVSRYSSPPRELRHAHR